MPPDSGPSPLISVTDLADALAASRPPLLLDVRWRLGGPPGIDSYRAGHLPGAVYVDLDKQLAGQPGAGGRHPLPETATFEAAMQSAGLRSDSNVVVYDDADASVAARAWWMLRYYGHDRVRVLNGGYRAWTGASLDVVTDEPASERGDFRAQPGQMPLLEADSAAQLAMSGVLLDARAPARYRGETEPIDPVAGHIPGAISAPTAENVTSDGLFRSTHELRTRFGDLGVKLPGHGGFKEATDAVGAYCGSGVTAAHEVLALELVGVCAALYVGSWSGWIADPERPIAVGPQPV